MLNITCVAKLAHIHTARNPYEKTIHREGRFIRHILRSEYETHYATVVRMMAIDFESYLVRISTPVSAPPERDIQTERKEAHVSHLRM